MQSNEFAGRVALVAGAGGGIGRAIALALARDGAEICVVGRNSEALEITVNEARQFAYAAAFSMDLTQEEDLDRLVEYLERRYGRLDILVHSAGAFHDSPLESAAVENLDLQYAINVRAPYVLTQRLLFLLTASHGQIVFVNSSLGLGVKRSDVGQYAATKHALRAVADSLREEVNPKGIRVLSVYPGRTATRMQEAIYKKEGRVYRAERLLQPQDIAKIIIQAISLPATAEVTDISIRPMIKD